MGLAYINVEVYMINFKSWLEANEKHVSDELDRFNKLLQNLPQIYSTDPKTNTPLTPDQTWELTQKDPKYQQAMQGFKKHNIPLKPDPMSIKKMIQKQQQDKKTAAPNVGTVGTVK